MADAAPWLDREEVKRRLIEAGFGPKDARKMSYALTYTLECTSVDPNELDTQVIFDIAFGEMNYSLTTARDIVRAFLTLKHGRKPRRVLIRPPGSVRVVW